MTDLQTTISQKQNETLKSGFMTNNGSEDTKPIAEEVLNTIRLIQMIYPELYPTNVPALYPVINPDQLDIEARHCYDGIKAIIESNEFEDGQSYYNKLYTFISPEDDRNYKKMPSDEFKEYENIYRSLKTCYNITDPKVYIDMFLKSMEENGKTR